ncbi:MAG TPA: polysaccharide deacetylase family protein [Solirubrobacterales bacterium]|jgi:peptidoglycan/xylan/chitin deacetylase (PgdA/CDA1 family)
MMVGPMRRRTLKSVYFRALGLLRVDRLLQAIRRSRGEVVVLNLHRVSPDPSPFWPPLAPDAFQALVAYLDRTCDVLTFGELAKGRGSDRLKVVLSFDDGCRDFVEYVAPILAKYRLRANLNVIVSSVETGQPPWTIALMDALADADATRVRGLEVPGFPHRLESDDDDAMVKYGTLLANYLKAMPPNERVDVTSDIEALLSETSEEALTPMMSIEDVVTVGDLHELGCHSYSHESMAQMDSEEFAGELDRCTTFFADLDCPMNIFAFPNGSYRSDQVETLLARGVEHILVVDERPSTTIRGCHPRITMYGDSAAELRLRGMGWRAIPWTR